MSVPVIIAYEQVVAKYPGNKYNLSPNSADTRFGQAGVRCWEHTADPSTSGDWAQRGSGSALFIAQHTPLYLWRMFCNLSVTTGCKHHKKTLTSNITHFPTLPYFSHSSLVSTSKSSSTSPAPTMFYKQKQVNSSIEYHLQIYVRCINNPRDSRSSQSQTTQ